MKTTTHNGTGFLVLQKGDVLSEEIAENLMDRLRWGQKTAATRMWELKEGDVVGQASGETRPYTAQAGAWWYDNGYISYTTPDGKPAQRPDCFAPRHKDSGLPKGREVAEQSYTKISEGTGELTLSDGSTVKRAYSVQLPNANPVLIVQLDKPIMIENSFGANEHQYLDEKPIIKVELKDGKLVVKGGVDGPEFKETWVDLGAYSDISAAAAKEAASDALLNTGNGLRRQMGSLAGNSHTLARLFGPKKLVV